MDDRAAAEKIPDAPHYGGFQPLDECMRIASGRSRGCHRACDLANHSYSWPRRIPGRPSSFSSGSAGIQDGAVLVHGLVETHAGASAKPGKNGSDFYGGI